MSYLDQVESADSQGRHGSSTITTSQIRILPTYISRKRGSKDNKGKDVLSRIEPAKGREGSSRSMGGIQITRWKSHEGMLFHYRTAKETEWNRNTDCSSGMNDSWPLKSSLIQN